MIYSGLLPHIYEHLFYKYFVRFSGYQRQKCKIKYLALKINKTEYWKYFCLKFLDLSYWKMCWKQILPHQTKTNRLERECRVCKSRLQRFLHFFSSRIFFLRIFHLFSSWILNFINFFGSRKESEVAGFFVFSHRRMFD